VYSILERELALWIVLDVVTTGAALHLGAFEKNPGPAWLMSVHPGLWVAGLVGILVVVLLAGRVLSRHYKNAVGFWLLPLPAMMECQAVINNLGVIRTLV
jgi:hypothetical protein